MSNQKEAEDGQVVNINGQSIPLPSKKAHEENRAKLRKELEVKESDQHRSLTYGKFRAWANNETELPSYLFDDPSVKSYKSWIPKEYKWADEFIKTVRDLGYSVTVEEIGNSLKVTIE